MSNSLWPHGLQHARLPCPSPSSGACSNSSPSSRWCHPTISFSVVHFSSCPQSFRVFPKESVLHIRWPKYRVSASTSVLPVNIQDWFPLELTGWISLQFKGHSSLLQHHSSKASIHQRSAFFMVQLSYLYMTTGETIALTRCAFWQSDVSAFLLFYLALS